MRETSTPSLPHNLDAERALLGACLLNQDVFQLCQHLAPAAFYEARNGLVFRAMHSLSKSGRAIDMATVHGWIADHEGAHLRPYLLDLLTVAARHRAHVEDHALVISDTASRREMIAVLDQLREIATQPPEGETASDVLSRAEALFRTLSLQSGPVDAWAQVGEAALEGMALIESGKRQGLPTGFSFLDAKTGGWRSQQASVFGARPSMGKSMLARAFCLNVAQAGYGAMLWSCEMSKDVIGIAMACALADNGARYLGEPEGPTISDALANRMSSRQRQAFDTATEKLRALPYYVDDRPGLTMPQIEAAARRKVREWEKQGVQPGVLVIDYLQKVRPATDRKGVRHLEVADLSGALRPMAYNLNLHVIAFAQVGRGIDSRDDKRPMMSDLRESGDIEQDADLIGFLFREAYYLERQAEEGDLEAEAKLRSVRNILDLNIAKQRNGPIGPVRLFISTDTGAIQNLEQRA